jgi:hypothetical protein
MSRMVRAFGVLVVLAAGSVAIGGCSAALPNVVTTPGPTVTVTATASPLESADSPLTAAEAWSVCWGAQLAYIGSENVDTSHWNSFDPTLIKADSGSYTITIEGGPIGTHGSLGCVVSGTLGDPKITDFEYTE